MRIIQRDPPRRYPVGNANITDCGTVELATDEQVTFQDGYDVTRKAWGWYATPSLNGRLAANALRAVIAVNPAGKAFVLLVEVGREPLFKDYLVAENMRVLTWLDNDQAVAGLRRQEES
jgi:hypothetical protein